MHGRWQTHWLRLKASYYWLAVRDPLLAGCFVFALWFLLILFAVLVLWHATRPLGNWGRDSIVF